jgi:hypothetical protein
MFSKGYLDTNVYVNLARKKVKEKQLRKYCSSIRLCIPNVLEITSKANPDNFKFQQLVAGWTGITTGPIEHSANRLLESWGLPWDKDQPRAARIALNRFIGAKNYKNIKKEIDDKKPLRNTSYLGFKKDVDKGISDWKNKFDQIKSQIPKGSPMKDKKTTYLRSLTSDEVMTGVLKNMRTHAYEIAGIAEPVEIADEEWAKAQEQLLYFLFFNAGYCAYGIQHQTEFNDFGDVSFMIFLADDSCVITSDVKMVEIAKEVGLEDKVFSPFGFESVEK